MWLAWIALQRQKSCLAFSTLRLLHGAYKSNQIRMAARSRVAPNPPFPPTPAPALPPTRSLSTASLCADRRRLPLLIPEIPPWGALLQTLRLDGGPSTAPGADQDQARYAWAWVRRLKVSAADLLLFPCRCDNGAARRSFLPKNAPAALGWSTPWLTSTHSNQLQVVADPAASCGMCSGQCMRWLLKKVVSRRGCYLFFHYFVFFSVKYTHLLLTKPQIPALTPGGLCWMCRKEKKSWGVGLGGGRGKWGKETVGCRANEMQILFVWFFCVCHNWKKGVKMKNGEK